MESKGLENSICSRPLFWSLESHSSAIQGVESVTKMGLEKIMINSCTKSVAGL